MICETPQCAEIPFPPAPLVAACKQQLAIYILHVYISCKKTVNKHVVVLTKTSEEWNGHYAITSNICFRFIVPGCGDMGQLLRDHAYGILFVYKECIYEPLIFKVRQVHFFILFR